MGLKWLITGGLGFIGLNLLNRITSLEGHSVRIIDNCLVGQLSDYWGNSKIVEVEDADALDFGTPVQFIKADIRNSEIAEKIAKDSDVIVHLAANTGIQPSVENPLMDCEINVNGTLNYLEAARINKVRKFIFASSGATVGEVNPPIHENMPTRPISPYGVSKQAGESYTIAYSRTYDLNSIVLRFSNVYGPGSKRKNSVVAKFIKDQLKGKTIEIFGDGSQSRDFIFVEDLIDAIILAANNDNIPGEIFQISTGVETTIRKLTGIISEKLAARAGIKVMIENAAERPGDVIRNFADNSKAERLLGWAPKVSIQDGLELSLDYFLNQEGLHVDNRE